MKRSAADGLFAKPSLLHPLVSPEASEKANLTGQRFCDTVKIFEKCSILFKIKGLRKRGRFSKAPHCC